MRALVVTLALLSAAHAQEAVPDTTDPARYYPLEVGNQWEYRLDGESPGPYATHFRTTVVADTLIEGGTWFVLRDQAFRHAAQAWERQRDERVVVRFDPVRATAVRWTTGGELALSPCPLDLPLTPDTGEPGTCDETGPTAENGASYVKADGLVQIGDDDIQARVVAFDGAVPGPDFAAGIGRLGSGGEGGPGTVLGYARVGGVEYGEPVERMPDVPDPTPPWRYYPLAVGNVWEYSECVPDPIGCWGDAFTRVEIARDTVIGAVWYAVEETQALENGFWSAVRDMRLLRFDTTAARAVQRGLDGTEWYVTCRLDADFGSMHNNGCGELVSQPAPGLKSYESTDSAEVYEAGIGFVFTYFWSYGKHLTYAHVGDVERGTAYAVASDPAPQAARLGLTLGPNPTAGPLVVTLDMPAPGAVTVEAFDALGRRVWHQDVTLGAGRQRLDVDAGAWAPGLYVVRATVGSEAATATVVRR